MKFIPVKYFFSYKKGKSIPCLLYFLYLELNMRVKISADVILKYFSYFFQKIGLDISCKLSPKETTCMKCQSPFSGKNKKKKIINLFVC